MRRLRPAFRLITHYSSLITHHFLPLFQRLSPRVGRTQSMHLPHGVLSTLPLSRPVLQPGLCSLARRVILWLDTPCCFARRFHGNGVPITAEPSDDARPWRAEIPAMDACHYRS